MSSEATDINNRGDIVGTNGVRFLDEPPLIDAVLWTRDGLINLGTLFGAGITSEATAINERGQVAGNTAVLAAQQAFRWEKGVLTNLGPLPGHSTSFAGAINNRGDIAGLSYPSSSVQTPHLVIWTDDRITDLGPPPGENIVGDVNTRVDGFNNRGQIVGTLLGFDSQTGLFIRPFVWQKGVFSQLPLPPGDTGGSANDINERGQIVGVSRDPGFVTRAVLWDRGTVTVLPTLPGSISSVAAGINNRGQIVGA